MKTIQLVISMPKKKHKKILSMIDAEILGIVSEGSEISTKKENQNTLSYEDSYRKAFVKAHNEVFPDEPIQEQQLQQRKQLTGIEKYIHENL